MKTVFPLALPRPASLAVVAAVLPLLAAGCGGELDVPLVRVARLTDVP